MALETTAMVSLFGHATVFFSKYLFKEQIDPSAVEVAGSLVGLYKTNPLKKLLKNQVVATNERLKAIGHLDKSEQLFGTTAIILKLGREKLSTSSLMETGIDGDSIWKAVVSLDAVAEKISDLDPQIRPIVPDLVIGLFDAWAADPSTQEKLKNLHINVSVDNRQKTSEILAVVKQLQTDLAAQGTSISDEQITALLDAFEEAGQPRESWHDLLLEKAKLLKDLQTRLGLLSNYDPEVENLRKAAKAAIEKPDLDAAQKLLERAEEIDAKAVDVIERDVKEKQQMLIQRKESQAASAFSQGELAESLLKYTDACQHYLRAQDLSPNDEEYLIKAAEFAWKGGSYEVGEQLAKKLLNKKEEELGPDHPDVAITLNNRANLYVAQGKHDEAEPLYQRALGISETAFGPDHPTVAITLNNLAEMYKAQGKFDRAEPLYERANEIGEKTLGPDHPDVAIWLNNLAGLYRAQGKYDEAEPLLQRAIEIGEKTLGPDHPDMATRLNNLAGLYKAQGKYDEAEPLYQRSITIGEKTLGPDHPDLAARLNNLAGLYRAQGKYDEAEPLYQRDLRISEKSLGPDHPDVATTLNNLANLYSEQGKYDRAGPLYERVVEIDEKTLGPDHPNVATTLNNLAGLYHTQGKYEEAEPFYKRAIAILEKAFPDGHPNLDTMRANYAAMIAERDAN